MAPRVVSGGPPAPDSPRDSQSPPPEGPEGDLELDLLGLANALYNLGTTVINDVTKDRDRPGAGKQVGMRVNDVVGYLRSIEESGAHNQTMIPFQVLTDIDNARNPMTLTKDRIERAAAENQFMNGKIAAIDSYHKLLDDALVQAFPELEPYLHNEQSSAESHVTDRPTHHAPNGIKVPNGRS